MVFWLCRTPLDSPVVPEVNSTTKGSSGPSDSPASSAVRPGSYSAAANWAWKEQAPSGTGPSTVMTCTSESSSFCSRTPISAGRVSAH